MKSIFILGFLFLSLNCELTRHSDDVLKRERIFIEAHRCVTEGQNNHNTKEAILDAIDKGVEAIETDAFLTLDKKVVLNHDNNLGNYLCEKSIKSGLKSSELHIIDLNFSDLEGCRKREGGYKIPLLDDIMQITKGKYL